MATQADTFSTYLIDASIYVFRAWFAFGDDLVDDRGHPVGAIFGFARFVAELFEQSAASSVAFGFDRSLKSSFRNDLYPLYKANRDPAPIELKRQFEHAQSFVAALGIHVMASDRYEADDLINAMAVRVRKKGHQVSIVSSDKDLAQCLCDGDELWDFARRRIVTPQTLREDLGLRPDQIADFLAIAGDAVDNIPGVKGVGKKTAVALLQQFDSLDGIYAEVDQLTGLSIRGAARIARLLMEQRDQAYLFRQLTVLHEDADLKAAQVRQLSRREPDWVLVDAMIDDLNLGESLKSRLRACMAPR